MQKLLGPAASSVPIIPAPDDRQVRNLDGMIWWKGILMHWEKNITQFVYHKSHKYYAGLKSKPLSAEGND